MTELDIKNLKALNITSKGPMFSIYLSRIDSIHDPKSIQDRWKESLSKAELYLLKDYPRVSVDNLISKLTSVNFSEKLDSLDTGIALFYSEDSFDGQVGYIKFQTPIHDLVVVADSFHIKPLIKIKNNVNGFLIVTMTSRAINVLIEYNGHLVKIDSYRNEPGSEGKNKKEAAEFFLNASRELNKLFNSYRLPIVLAGVKSHLGTMKKLLNQSMLIKESVVGNVEKIKAIELREKVYQILHPYYELKTKSAVSDLENAIYRNRIVTDLEQIAQSAVLGKITKLIVVENKYIWGSINKDTGEIFISPRQINSHDDDILDDLCQIVLERNGEVVVVKEIPNLNGDFAIAIVSDLSHLSNEPVSHGVAKAACI
ncbi:MAG: hypothetical protein HOP07_08120 [Bacteriovoracaceae bacterium]|nr:hypothetical protein [Bacteriovoracaceae bacterium]